MNNLFTLCLSLSLSGTLLAFALVLLRPILRQFSKRWNYYIWLLVLMRMLLPFGPETKGEPILQSIGQNPLTEAAAGLSPLKYGNGFSISDPSGPMSAVSLSSMLESHIFSVVWLALALLLLLRKLYLYGQAASAIRSQSKEAAEGPLPTVLQKVKAAMGIKRSITVCTNSFIKAPLLTGLVRPTMVLPAQVYSNTELEYIFMHELTHYRRGDLFYKWLVEITLCLHWFNPMVYWIRKQVSRHCELSCDEAVISRFDSHRRKSYGNVLLDAAGSDIESKRNRLALSLNEDGKLLAERLRAISHYKQASKSVRFLTLTLTVVLLCAAIAAGMATGCSLKENGQSAPMQSAAPAAETMILERVTMERCEGEDGHPYVHDVRTNNTKKTIVRVQCGMLAFDKEGNPLKIDWRSTDSQSEKTYLCLSEDTLIEILPGETFDEFGGWSLNIFGTDANVAKIAYVLYCDKEIECKDGSLWKNPDFENWRASYEGKKIDVKLLENYYPYVQAVAF